MSMFLGDTRFTKKTYLMNAYATKGVIKESGIAFDATTLWLMTPQRNPGGSIGLGYEVAKWGTSENFEKIKHLNFSNIGPVQVEVEIEEVTTGSGEKQKKVTVCHNLRLIQLSDMSKDMSSASSGNAKKAS
jgi:hypothetical protein